MTTMVHVNAAGGPAEVIAIEYNSAHGTSERRVLATLKPFEEWRGYIYSGREILVREIEL